MKTNYLTLFLLLSTFFSAPAQKELTDKEILKLMKASQIEWNETFGEKVAKVQFAKDQKWGLYSIETSYANSSELPDNFHYEEIVPAKFDSLGWFTDYDYKFSIVKQENKYGLLLYPGEFYDALDRVYCDFDAIKVIEPEQQYSSGYDSEIYVYVKYQGKWGLIDWMGGSFVVEPIYKTIEQVPAFFVPYWHLNEFRTIRQKMDIDSLKFDDYNTDGVFKSKNSHTGKWGMFRVVEDTIAEIIPPEYDQIDMFIPNNYFTGVYINHKVGIYLSKVSYNAFTKQTVPCNYEDYRVMYFDEMPYLAMQKNNKWGWVNWLTGEEKTAFEHPSPEELPKPDYQQTNWMED